MKRNKSTKNILTMDIRRGLKSRITGTPAFRINDNLYIGSIPPELVKMMTSE